MKNFWRRYRYSVILLRELVRTDFKLRYQGSALGYVWSLLRPLFLFVILYFVFTRFLKVGGTIPHYPVYLLLGIVLWNYFVEVTTGSVSAIVGKGDLLRKINFPKYVIIFAGSFAALINLGLNFIVITIFILLSHFVPSWSALLLLPLILELFITSIALAFFLSALYVKFRDVSYIWDVIVQAGFYATPILYTLTLVPLRYAKIIILNPLAQIIQDARWALITDKTLTIYQLYGGNKLVWLVPISASIILAILAGAYFRTQSKYFAEDV